MFYVLLKIFNGNFKNSLSMGYFTILFQPPLLLDAPSLDADKEDAVVVNKKHAMYIHNFVTLHRNRRKNLISFVLAFIFDVET